MSLNSNPSYDVLQTRCPPSTPVNHFLGSDGIPLGITYANNNCDSSEVHRRSSFVIYQGEESHENNSLCTIM